MTGESVTSFRKLGAVMGGGTQNNNNNHPLQSIRTDEIEIQVLDPQHNHHQDNVNKVSDISQLYTLYPLLCILVHSSMMILTIYCYAKSKVYLCVIFRNR